MKSNQLFFTVLLLLVISQANAGPLLYTLCMIGCNTFCFTGTAVAAAATAGAGAVVGTGCIPGCMSGCLITGVAPTP